MSILRSTSSGRGYIKVNVDYLLSVGWHYVKVPISESIDEDHIWKNNHRLKIVNFSSWATEENFRIPIFHEEIGDYVYNLPIFSLYQLDDVEEFWKICDEVDFETAEKFLLEKYPYVKSRNALKDVYDTFTADITSSIDKKIVERITKNR